MVGNALEVMPLAMHLRLSFTNALPCGEKIKAGRGQKTGVVHTLALSRSHPYRLNTCSERMGDVR